MFYVYVHSNLQQCHAVKIEDKKNQHVYVYTDNVKSTFFFQIQLRSLSNVFLNQTNIQCDLSLNDRVIFY